MGEKTWGCLLAKLIQVNRPGMKLPLNSTISSQPFGVAPGGEPIEAWTLTGSGGLQLQAIPYGAIITRILVPDRNGRLDDVVLGFNSLEPYLKANAYFGAAIGRVAGRISGGSFTVDGRPCQLARNDGLNHLHGGIFGFDKKIWDVKATQFETGEPSLVFRYTSPDGEEGYPGSVHVQLTYTVAHDNRLVVDVQAEADRTTPFNFTQHSYFNLAGEGSGTIADHQLQIQADGFVPVDDNMALTGKLAPLDGECNDFRQPRRLGDAIPLLFRSHGDLYRIPSSPLPPGDQPSLRLAARLGHPESGRTLEVSSTEDFLQLYTGVGISAPLPGKSGRSYGAFAGLCLECEGYPNAADDSGLGDILLRPGKPKHATTIFHFSIQAQEPPVKANVQDMATHPQEQQNGK